MDVQYMDVVDIGIWINVKSHSYVHIDGDGIDMKLYQ